MGEDLDQPFSEIIQGTTMLTRSKDACCSYGMAGDACYALLTACQRMTRFCGEACKFGIMDHELDVLVTLWVPLAPASTHSFGLKDTNLEKPISVLGNTSLNF